MESVSNQNNTLMETNTLMESNTAPAPAPATATAPTPQLSLNTLSQVVNILIVCSQRGVFKIEELELVGKTYNELSRFIRESAEVNTNATNTTNANNTNNTNTTNANTNTNNEVNTIETNNTKVI